MTSLPDQEVPRHRRPERRLGRVGTYRKLVQHGLDVRELRLSFLPSPAVPMHLPYQVPLCVLEIHRQSAVYSACIHELGNSHTKVNSYPAASCQKMHISALHEYSPSDRSSVQALRLANNAPPLPQQGCTLQHVSTTAILSFAFRPKMVLSVVIRISGIHFIVGEIYAKEEWQTHAGYRWSRFYW